jgi:hypothetical protein
MATAVIESFKEKNWNVRYYWNEDLKEEMPIIIGPRGHEFRFPCED